MNHSRSLENILNTLNLTVGKWNLVSFVKYVFCDTKSVKYEGVVLCMKNHRDVTAIQEELKPHQLIVNTDKTEYTTIQRSTDEIEKQWRVTKKVGSLIGDKDVARLKSLSTAALNKLSAI